MPYTWPRPRRYRLQALHQHQLVAFKKRVFDRGNNVAKACAYLPIYNLVDNTKKQYMINQDEGDG